jgi:HlyD family secretion protein
LRWRTDQLFVANDQTRLAKVTIGHNSGVYAEVVDGVSAGDKVIVHPPDLVAEGVKIRARQADGS